VHEDEWPPPEARYRSALWRGEGHLERGEWYHAWQTLSAASADAPAGERELVRGLVHLAAGYKRREGDARGAERQLAHARRRLSPYLPEHGDLDLAALLETVARD
jgi:hypothetical protein